MERMKLNLSKQKKCKRKNRISTASVEQEYTSLTRYIEQRDWEGVLESGSRLVSYNSCHGQNILHRVCRSQPPYHVVNAIVRICPPYLESIDNNGYTPLHTAAECGASPQVIQILIQSYPQAASIKEYRGKTPLHLYCEKGHFNRLGDVDPESFTSGEKEYVAEDGISCEVITSLTNAAPMNVTDEDEDGLSALEYAIISGADFQFVRLLQKFSANLSQHLSERDKMEKVLDITPNLYIQGKKMSVTRHSKKLKRNGTLSLLKLLFSS